MVDSVCDHPSSLLLSYKVCRGKTDRVQRVMLKALGMTIEQAMQLAWRGRSIRDATPDNDVDVCKQPVSTGFECIQVQGQYVTSCARLDPSRVCACVYVF